MSDRRRTFGPVVLLGLAAGGLTAVAGNQPAAEIGRGTGSGLVTYDAHLPAVTALGLVVLASWGVVLVTRGRVRRAVAALGVAAGVGALVAVALAYSAAPDQLRDELAAVGVTDVSIAHTAWFWAAVAGAIGSVATTALAVAWAPQWPEMGSKYDAPTAPPVTSQAPPEEQSNLDLWKALDEGRDPTAPKTDDG
jgi:uncharacterized membrane protein (TIGR02234 family)